MNRRKFNINICQCAGFGLLAMTTGISAIANVQRKSKGQKGAANKAGRKEEGKLNLFRDPDAGYVIEFPAGAKVTRDNSFPGIRYIAEAAKYVFMVQTTNNNRGYTNWPEAQIQSAVNNFNSNNHKVTSVRILSPNIYEMRYLAPIRDRPGVFLPTISRAILTNDREHFLVVTAGEGFQLEASVANRFFSSFRVISVGNVQPDRNSPSAGYIACSTCQGTGKLRKLCMYCLGTGKTESSRMDTEGYWCRWCDRSGYTRTTCWSCGGQGQIAR